MSGSRDYRAFLSFLSALVPIDVRALQSSRSIGGYLALRVAADQFMQDGKVAFDMDFYRDERAEGGVSTRPTNEPRARFARAWLVGAHIKVIAERFMTNGALDVERIRSAMAHDELLRVRHGERIRLDRANLNALTLLRGRIPSRRADVARDTQRQEVPSIGLVH